jgi:5-methylcytosine-specific restriction enzyme B
VQILTDREFATIGAIIGELLPDVQQDILQIVPGAADIEIVGSDTSDAKNEPPATPLVAEIGEDDEVMQQVRRLIEEDGWGGVLITGAPGTGKTWYASQIAILLTAGDRHRIREVQFHPSYQYEDFVEGYVPDGKQGFRLSDKHMLEMAEVAKNTNGPVVLVIDEFSRTDPARVLGETMTYMESSMRGKEFYLPSGRRVMIPKNLIFLATMNPEDRSVDEIDAAMERRWAKIALKPDVKKLRDFLTKNKAPVQIIGPIVELFNGLQKYLDIGHAFFRTVKDSAGAARLWNSQLHYVIKKRFRFDADTLRDIEALWTECENGMNAATAASASAAAPATAAGPNAPKGPASGVEPETAV